MQPCTTLQPEISAKFAAESSQTNRVVYHSSSGEPKRAQQQWHATSLAQVGVQNYAIVVDLATKVSVTQDIDTLKQQRSKQAIARDSQSADHQTQHPIGSRTP